MIGHCSYVGQGNYHIVFDVLLRQESGVGLYMRKDKDNNSKVFSGQPLSPASSNDRHSSRVGNITVTSGTPLDLEGRDSSSFLFRGLKDKYLRLIPRT